MIHLTSSFKLFAIDSIGEFKSLFIGLKSSFELTILSLEHIFNHILYILKFIKKTKITKITVKNINIWS